MKTKTTFSQLYNFPGFRAQTRFKCGVFQDPRSRVVDLVRRQKKRFVQVASAHRGVFTITASTAFVIWQPGVIEFIWTSSIGVWTVNGARP